MAEYIPSPTDWVRETGGTIRGQRRLGRNYPPRDWAVCHHRDEPWELDGSGTQDVSDEGEGRGQLRPGRFPRRPAPENLEWVYNLRPDGNVQLPEEAEVYTMRVREVDNADERARLWDLAVAAFPPYAEYRDRTTRRIPLFVAEPA